MPENTIGILLFVAFGCMVLSCWTEMFLSATWNAFYYMHGLPLLVRRISVASFHTNLPSTSRLEAQFSSCLTGSLAFRQVFPDTYGFRSKCFTINLSDSNITHGTLQFDRTERCVVLKAFINWWVLAIGLFLTAFLAVGATQAFILGPLPGLDSSLGFLLFPAVFAILFGGGLLLELSRCRRIAQFASKAWERAYDPEEQLISLHPMDSRSG